MRFSTFVMLLMLGSACSPTEPSRMADIIGTWEGTAALAAVGFGAGANTHTASFSFTQSGSGLTGTWTLTSLTDPDARISGTLSGRIIPHTPTFTDIRENIIEVDLVSTCGPDTIARADGYVDFISVISSKIFFRSSGFGSTASNCRSGELTVSLNARRPLS